MNDLESMVEAVKFSIIIRTQFKLSADSEYSRLESDFDCIMRDLSHIVMETRGKAVRRRFYHLIFEDGKYRAWTRHYDPLFVSDDSERVVNWLIDLIISDYEREINKRAEAADE